MANDQMSRFFGGSPGKVVLRLIFISFVVGIVLSAINLHPLELFQWVENIVIRIWNMGFDALGRLGGYFVLGAVVVFPIWIVVRLLKMGRGEA